MKLGNILMMKGGTPETGRPVRFQLRQKQKSGAFTRVWAEAQLLPVTVSEVAEVHAAVAEHLAEHPGANKEDEINIRFLAKALHDSKRNHLKFVETDQVDKFAGAIVMEQVAVLILEYKLMLREQYPECWATQKEKEEAEQQAEDFSDDGQELLSES